MITKREVEEIEYLAEFHSDKVPVVYGDGEQSVEKMLPLNELSTILFQMSQDNDGHTKSTYINDPMASVAYYFGYAYEIAKWKNYKQGDKPPYMKYHLSENKIEQELYKQLNVIWAYCVICFGDYGVNPSCGWIEDFEGFHKWIDEVVELEEESLL